MAPSMPTHLPNLTVGFAMHHGVLAAPAACGLSAVAAIMAANQVHAVMVGGERAQMITDLDVLAAHLAGDPDVTAGRGGRSVPVFAPDTPLESAARALVDAEAAHALVRGASDSMPSGVLSAFDVVAVLGGMDPRSAGLPRPRPARPALSERRIERVRAAEVAHRGLIAVSPSTPIADLASVLAHHRIHCATVIGVDPAPGGERLVWAFASIMDVLAAIAGGQTGVRASDIAGTELLTVDADETLDAVAARMVDHAAGHVIVTDAEAMPIGVVSTLDVIAIVGGA
jgi:predicted transcriptional regulator